MIQQILDTYTSDPNSYCFKALDSPEMSKKQPPMPLNAKTHTNEHKKRTQLN